eukprot:scaffold311769_cov32-Tisochrysis_lutea.AAC.2
MVRHLRVERFRTDGIGEGAGSRLSERDRDARQAPLLMPHPPLPLVPVEQRSLQLYRELKSGRHAALADDGSSGGVEPDWTLAPVPFERDFLLAGGCQGAQP